MPQGRSSISALNQLAYPPTRVNTISPDDDLMTTGDRQHLARLAADAEEYRLGRMTPTPIYGRRQPQMGIVDALRMAGQDPSRRFSSSGNGVVEQTDNPGDEIIDTITPEMRDRWQADDMASSARRNSALDLEAGASARNRVGDLFDLPNATRQARVQASVAPQQQDTADYIAKRGALRYFDPDVMHERAHEQEFKMQMATEPARIAAGSRENVVQQQGQTALQVALAKRSSPEEIIAAQLDDWTRSGVFGVDRSGRPMPPPPDVQARAHALLMQMFGQAQGGPGNGSENQDDFQPGDKRQFPDGRVEQFDGMRWQPIR